MKNKKNNLLKKMLIIICLTISITLSFAMVNRKPTFADSGFGTSYHSGGSSSYSGGSSYSRGSSYRSHSYDDDYDEELGFVVAILILIVLGIIQLFINGMNKKTKKNIEDIPIDENKIEEKIKQYIPDFNKEQFMNDGYKIYLDVQDAWMNFKLEDVKDIITDELYNMYEAQLTTLEVKGEQNIMKDFELKGKFLKDVNKQNDIITITTGYVIEFYDYIINQENGNVLRGTDKSKVRITYEMKFRQTLDKSKKVTKCPNCGAEVDMNVSTVCEYCHTKLVTENTRWVLTEKKTMNQEYV